MVECRRQDDQDDQQHDRFDIMLHAGNPAADKESEQCYAERPGDVTDGVIQYEFGPRHVGGTGGDRDEGTHDRDEMRHQHGLTAVLFIKLLSFHDVLMPKNQTVFVEQPRAETLADLVADVIAKNGGDGDGNERQTNWQVTLSCKDTGAEEQSVAGEEETDQHARFGKNYQRYK